MLFCMKKLSDIRGNIPCMYHIPHRSRSGDESVHSTSYYFENSSFFHTRCTYLLTSRRSFVPSGSAEYSWYYIYIYNMYISPSFSQGKIFDKWTCERCMYII